MASSSSSSSGPTVNLNPLPVSQETARNLLREGAVAVFLDVPEGTEFGVDYHTWQVGPRFKGVKMIPPGLHYFHFSATSMKPEAQQTAPRVGFFTFLRAGEFYIKSWDKSREQLVDERVTNPEEIERFTSGITELDQYLGAYPFDDGLKRWLSLTSYISESFLHRVEVSSEGSSMKYSDIPRHGLVPPGCILAEISLHNMDWTYTLQSLMATSFDGDENNVLGELQLSFVSFLIGHDFDGFEQWKKLVHLLCTCEGAMIDRPLLFYNFIGVLHYQLKETPEDFFLDIVSRNNFLTSSLSNFFSIASSNSNLDGKLLQRINSFKQLLRERFRWNFEEDDEEDGPVVVEE